MPIGKSPVELLFDRPLRGDRVKRARGVVDAPLDHVAELGDDIGERGARGPVVGDAEVVPDVRVEDRRERHNVGLLGRIVPRQHDLRPMDVAVVGLVAVEIEAAESKLDPVALGRQTAADRLDVDMWMPREDLSHKIVVRLEPSKTRIHPCASGCFVSGPGAPQHRLCHHWRSRPYTIPPPNVVSLNPPYQANDPPV